MRYLEELLSKKLPFWAKKLLNLVTKATTLCIIIFPQPTKKLNKNKKLNTDVWYDEKTLNWVKASFNKKGKWEYRLIIN